MHKQFATFGEKNKNKNKQTNKETKKKQKTKKQKQKQEQTKSPDPNFHGPPENLTYIFLLYDYLQYPINRSIM